MIVSLRAQGSIRLAGFRWGQTLFCLNDKALKHEIKQYIFVLLTE